MPFTVSLSTDRFHVVGDSIVAWNGYSGPGCLLSQFNRAAPSPPVSPDGVLQAGSQLATMAGQSAGKGVGLISQLAYTQSGVPGNVVADIAGNVAARITAFNPTKLIIAVGVNDATLGTAPATFLSTYQSLITAALAANVGLTTIGMVTALCSGCLWASGGSPWGANTFDTAIANINAQLVTLAANNPSTCVLLDTRTPLGLWLQAHAPGPPGTSSGPVTYDGTHPNSLLQVLMGQWCMSSITVTA